MTSDPGDLVLDPTGGSGSAAVVSERHGRRWIVIDSSPVSIATMRHYLAAQTYDWYLLQDSEEGAEKEVELGGTSLNPPNGRFTDDPAFGFVYDRRPDVSAGKLTADKPSPPILIVNNPYRSSDIKKRVTGPFTVESETSSYTISTSDPDSYREFSSRLVGILEDNGIDALSGDDNTRMENIEGVPGLPYTHIGHMDGRQAAVLIAPEFRAVDNRMIHDAAASARKHHMDRLVVVAFEFQPLVADPIDGIEITRVCMNRALQQKELDSSKVDRSFVMLADPSIGIKNDGDRWSVEVLGYNTYDPASGSMVPGDVGDVDCWMLDTDYDRESFYAREIHFPNVGPKWAQSQMKQIKKMLGVSLDQDRWDAHLSLKSAPFRSETGRIAVKIITTCGDEMLTEHNLFGPCGLL